MRLIQVGLFVFIVWFVVFQAEDGIRDLVRSRGLGDVYKRQDLADQGAAIGFGHPVVRLDFLFRVDAGLEAG